MPAPAFWARETGPQGEGVEASDQGEAVPGPGQEGGGRVADVGVGEVGVEEEEEGEGEEVDEHLFFFVLFFFLILLPFWSTNGMRREGIVSRVEVCGCALVRRREG